MKLKDHRREALRTFVAGYLHGRSSLGNHEAVGREAEAAFNKWWAECGSREEVLVTKPTPSAGKCQPLGDPAASCTGTYPDVDGTYADCGDYDCPRHVPAASSTGQPAKPEAS